MRRVIITVVAANLIATGIGSAQQPVDPIIGTWELNLAKSTYRSGPPPKAEIRTFEMMGDSLKYTAKGTDAQGRPMLRQFVARYDGKDYPATGHPTADSIAYTRIDTHTTKAVLKKASKILITNTRVVAKDGKMFTLTDDAIDADGMPVSNVLVFDRR